MIIAAPGTADLENGEIKSVLLTAGSAAATLVVTDASSNVVFSLSCPEADSRYVQKSGAIADRFPIPKGCTATLTGTGAWARID